MAEGFAHVVKQAERERLVEFLLLAQGVQGDFNLCPKIRVADFHNVALAIHDVFRVAGLEIEGFFLFPANRLHIQHCACDLEILERKPLIAGQEGAARGNEDLPVKDHAARFIAEEVAVNVGAIEAAGGFGHQFLAHLALAKGKVRGAGIQDDVNIVAGSGPVAGRTPFQASSQISKPIRMPSISKIRSPNG
jgi:hypothetical protein